MLNPMSRFPTTLSTVASLAAALVSWPMRVAAARRVLRQVAGMSDGELRDIGLSRSDLSDAAALPRASDPGQMFRARAEARRSARLDFGAFS